MKTGYLVHGLMFMAAALLAACATTNPWCGGDDCKAVPGEIDGHGSMSGGSAHYDIDMELPANSGFRPNLSIWYSSRGGNGILGMGWAVSEYSSVFRCPATSDMDGFSSGVRYSADDRLCINGAHLFPISGKYGKDGTRYHTEQHDSFEVLEVGDINDPHSSFVQTYDDGIEVTYGEPFIPAGAPAPLTWNETLLENNRHDVISYKYEEVQPGEKLLSEVRFTGKDNGGKITEGHTVVRYEYEVRPDSRTSYLAGGHDVQTRRLADIVMGTDGSSQQGGIEKQLEYDFHYTQSGATDRTLLAGVMRCRFRSQGLKECSTPTSAYWQQAGADFAEPQSYGIPQPEQAAAPAWHPGDVEVPAPPLVHTYDYDGDGRVDLLYARPGVAPHLYMVDMAGKLSHDVDVGGYVHESGMQWTRSAGDLINIGAANLFGEVDGHFGYTYWDGKAMGKAVPTAIPYSPLVSVGDYDGDGHPDVLQLEQSKSGGFTLRLYRNAGSSPAKSAFFAPMDILTLPAGHYALQWPMDIDGNGCADALLVREGRIVELVLFSQDVHGVVHAKAQRPSDYGIHPDPVLGSVQFADINSDGLNDLVYVEAPAGAQPTWHYQLNTGAGFDAPVDTGVVDSRPAGVGHSGTLVADVNNDGRDDLIFPSVLVREYCLTVSGADGASRQLCSSDELGTKYPSLDLGIYRYGALRFVTDAQLVYRPVLMPDLGIIAQANLAATGSLHGDGLTQVFSPFDPWFSNGGFKGADGKLSACPAGYGCGLRVDSNAFGYSRADSRDVPPDLVLQVDKSRSASYTWHYYPLANSIRAQYSVPPMGSPERYIDDDSFYFTSSMYVVGDFSEREGGREDKWIYEYGAAAYSNGGRGMEGFRWIVNHSLNFHMKFVNWYRQDFPYTGDRVSSWSELESGTGDDYLHGVPGERYIDYIRFTYDCQGPADRPQSQQAGCLEQGDGTFLVRKRSSREIKRDTNTGSVISDVSQRFEYDSEGNLIQNDDGND